MSAAHSQHEVLPVTSAISWSWSLLVFWPLGLGDLTITVSITRSLVRFSNVKATTDGLALFNTVDSVSNKTIQNLALYQ